MINILAVGIGGAIGSILRYLVSLLVKFPFPWATLIVNIAGSAILGFLVASSFFSGDDKSPIRLMLLVGFCGGFTTFSTFSLQTLNLMQAGQLLEACLNILFNLLGCLTFTFLGYWLARLLMPVL